MKNVDLMLQCDECAMWRLLYSRFKLTKKEKSHLQHVIEDILFTCGAPLQDLELPGRLNEVYTRELSCGETIEKLYYTIRQSILRYVSTVQKKSTAFQETDIHNAALAKTNQKSRKHRCCVMSLFLTSA